MRKLARLPGLLCVLFVLAGASDDEFEFALRAAEGEKVYYESTTRISAVIQGSKTNNKGTTILQFEGRPAGDDGSGGLGIKILKLRYKLSNGEYDSESGKRTVTSMTARMYDAMVKTEIEPKISAGGQMSDDGTKPVVRQVADIMMEEHPAGKNPSGKEVPQTVWRKAQFSVDTAYGASLFAFLPEKKVALNETWMVKQALPIVNLTWHVKLYSVKKSRGRTLATLTLNLTGVEIDADANVGARYVPDGKEKVGNGKIVFDLD
ncbi:MAG: hypothetical protein ACYTAF_08565, partial [Planctomycetota bacterium]